MDFERFERMGYRFHGQGSVEICRWNKNALTGRGVCYKQKFYGVPTHRCMEFTPNTFTCTNNCVYCWRPEEFMLSGKSEEDPGEMVEVLIEKRKALLMGFKGNPKTDQKLFAESIEPVHFAISLAGEPTAYPRLSELVDYLLKRQGTFSVFLVTNGQHPEALERLQPLPTQIYLSMTAPNEADYKKISVPQLKDFWERFMRSCDFLAKTDTRTITRITLIKGLNMNDAEGWAELIRRANAHFVEFKGYSWIGYSKMRLKLENVPTLEEVREFATKVMKHIDYDYMDEEDRSRIVVYKNKGRLIDRIIKE